MFLNIILIMWVYLSRSSLLQEQERYVKQILKPNCNLFSHKPNMNCIRHFLLKYIKLNNKRELVAFKMSDP